VTANDPPAGDAVGIAPRVLVVAAAPGAELALRLEFD
jgi:hypothetical protein